MDSHQHQPIHVLHSIDELGPAVRLKLPPILISYGWLALGEIGSLVDRYQLRELLFFVVYGEALDAHVVDREKVSGRQLSHSSEMQAMIMTHLPFSLQSCRGVSGVRQRSKKIQWYVIGPGLLLLVSDRCREGGKVMTGWEGGGRRCAYGFSGVGGPGRGPGRQLDAAREDTEGPQYGWMG